MVKKIDCAKIGTFIFTLSCMACTTSGGGGNLTGSVDSNLARGESAAQTGRQTVETETGVKASQTGLTDLLVSQLGVSQQQALGGAGAIFQAAKARMDPLAFTTLSQSIPGMSSMLSTAPKVSDSMSGVTSGISSMMGDKNKTLGSMGSLAASFKQLNLSPEMVNQFVPVVVDYVRNASGQAMAKLLQSALTVP